MLPVLYLNERKPGLVYLRSWGDFHPRVIFSFPRLMAAKRRLPLLANDVWQFGNPLWAFLQVRSRYFRITYNNSKTSNTWFSAAFQLKNNVHLVYLKAQKHNRYWLNSAKMYIWGWNILISFKYSRYVHLLFKMMAGIWFLHQFIGWNCIWNGGNEPRNTVDAPVELRANWFCSRIAFVYLLGLMPAEYQ